MFGWYERHVVPWIVRCGCGSEALDDYRKQVVPQAQGTVLELGVGAGANLPFYDATKVKRLVGIEPSPELRTIAARAERAVGLDVAIQAGEGENLEFDLRLTGGDPSAMADAAAALVQRRPDSIVAQGRPVVGGCPKSLRWHSGGLYACCRSGWIGTHSVTIASRRRVDRIYQFRTFGRQ